MKAHDDNHLLLSDTPVADLFLTDVMPYLDEWALKAYLVALQASCRGHGVEVERLASRLGLSCQKTEQALKRLVAHGVVSFESEIYQLVDLKTREVERYIERRMTKADSVVVQGDVCAHERAIRSVNDTYFQGAMSHRWYMLIDEWFGTYGFEPDVVYTLFSILAERHKLGHTGYARAIADDWHRKGITTFEALSRHQEHFSEQYAFCQKVARAIHLDLTSYHEALIKAWREELGYDFDIVDIALKRAVHMNQSKNLMIYDKMLRAWHSAGLATREEIEAYEAKHAATKSGRRAIRPARDNRGNYGDAGDDSVYDESLVDGVPDLRTRSPEEASCE